MNRSLSNHLWYAFLKFVMRLTAVAAFQFRCQGRAFVPATGPGLILSNHQSHFDPLLIGLASDRRLNYVARKTLFRFAPLRWFIKSVNAFPIDREGTGFGGLKESLKRLKQGEVVVLFPEGTRSPDGQVHAVKPGFVALARRTGVPLLPVAIAGAYDAWPRRRRFPSLGVIHVVFGQPIGPAEVSRLDDQQLVAEVERRIRACHALACQTRQQAIGIAPSTTHESGTSRHGKE